MNKEQFKEEVAKLGINLTDKMLIELDEYFKILVSENEKYNLTSITNECDVYLKHFYDSITLYKMIDLNNQKILDIGTGAGFPGMVLKIVFPNLEVTLLDSTSKKCNFLNMVIEKLHLKKITVINARAEEYAKENREKYDIVVSRAVAPLPHLLEYSIPTLIIGGRFISLKSNIEQELNDIKNYYKEFKLINEKIIKFNLPVENSLRTIYSIEKSGKTSNKYPRTYAQIKKNIL